MVLVEFKVCLLMERSSTTEMIREYIGEPYKDPPFPTKRC